MTSTSDIEFFEKARPRLLGLAYRMLGSMADAEDAVQDTFVKWQGMDRHGITSADAYLTTICTNRCLDYLKAAHRKRVGYVGPWIPEPLQIEVDTDPESDLARAQSLTTAFLLLLERLTAKERAAYLLREVFGKPYQEVAEILGLREITCRQLVSRATRFVRSQSARSVPTAEQQDLFLKAFLAAVETGSTEQLSRLLAESVQLRTDGGGKAAAISRVLEGSEVLDFIVKAISRLWDPRQIIDLQINGVRGLAQMEDGRIVTAMTLGFTEGGLVDQILIVRNPDKLERLALPTRHDAGSGALWQ